MVVGINEILINHGLRREELPSNILEILRNYSDKLWRELSLKYHPDKYGGKDIYSKLLNALKEFHKSKN